MQAVIQDDEALANIAANVRFLLAERGWTQSELARMTDEPQMAISRLANGRNMPGAGTLARVAEAFRTSVDWLIADHSKEIRQTA